ncbi:MAG: S-methyl-5-thioribose-1-phosphate isomerase, partial [Phycisphaerae bacterium]
MSAIAYPQLARDERRRLGDLPLTLEWIGDEDGALRLLDQTRLPGEVVMIDCRDVDAVWEAIRALRVRGAPAIGVAAAYGVYLGVRGARNASIDEFDRQLARTAKQLCDARPTAVNLAWAVRRVSDAIGGGAGLPAERARRALEVAHELAAEDADVCRRIGEAGAPLVPEGGGVLTHCNAGALATAGSGTALSVFYEAHR